MDKSNQSRMKIIVTGAAGNIGSVLIPYLTNCGHTVIGIDIKQNYHPGYIVADVNNVADMVDVFNKSKPDVVIHMAAMVSRVTCEQSPAITIQTNLAGTMNMIQLCKTFNSKLVFFSTSEIYGNVGGVLHENITTPEPNNIYGLSKYLGEQLVRYEAGNGLDAIIVRPFMFYHENETVGDHRSAMIRFADALVRWQPITVHAGASRSWLHLDDGVQIIEKLCHAKGFHIVNVGHHDIVSMADLAHAMCLWMGRNDDFIKIQPLPERMTLTKIPSLKIMHDLTGYTPQINITEGVKRVIERVKYNQVHQPL